MASRRKAREYALQVLYSADLAEVSVGDALRGLWAGQMDGELAARPAESAEVEFAEGLCRGVESRRDEIDALIEKASANWRLQRMPVVDRNILRLAAYELLAMQDIPASVSINEGVELAKAFGEKESRAFVNGILDRIAYELGRGGRRHKKKK
ncbi:MAG: transcription antitermination factor NusB [Alphaproteobacteria bacterium]|nr:transcription antitermination factor NusB [Alphaproteobacteria bacterium]